MNSYLLINITLTGSALAVNHYMKIPHRIRFYIMLTAVIAWLIPFTLFSIELPNQVVTLIPVQLTQLNEPLFSNQPVNQSDFSMMTVFYIMMSLGLAKFMVDWFATKTHIKKIETNSNTYQHQHNIRLVQGITGAFVSGYFRPIIWIDEQLQDAETLPSVIAHEQQHIRSNDQFWLFIITLVQRLFWFNPLSLVLCRQSKNSIELSCDEACKKQLGQKQYQSHLAQLIIDQNHKTMPLMNNQIHQNKQFNVHRIKQLEQENIMTKSKTTHLCFIVLSALLLSTYSLITVAHNTTMPNLADDQILLELKIQKNNESIKEMKLINRKGKMAQVTYDNHIFGFTSRVMPDDPNLIYTEVLITETNNAKNMEVAKPAIITTNAQWGGVKFTEDEQTFDISIMARTNNGKDTVPVPPKPQSAPKPELPTVPAATQSAAPLPESVPIPEAAPQPVTALKPVSVPTPVPAVTPAVAPDPFEIDQI